MRAGRVGIAAAGVAVALLAAIPAAARAAVTPATIHVVQPGDTLWAIARRYQVPVDALVAANNLADADVLSLGQRLVIPPQGSGVAPSSTPAASARTATVTHVVVSGDTLWSLASRYEVTVETIVRENNLTNPDRLSLGQRLRIPGVVGREPATSSKAGSRAKAGSGAAPRTAVRMAGRIIPADAVPSRGAKWGSALLAVGSRVVGVRYRWGGTTPRGFDCSGFITYVMRAVGVAVPRTVYAMWVSGRPVPRNQLRVGDIVFFTTTRPGPSHAGIFIGNNQFIHSSSGFGRVTITSMDYRYYKPRYLGARRF